MPILTAPIDLGFIFLAITIMAGIFVLYKSIRHYQLIKSQEYLVLVVVFFNLTFFALYRIWRVYLSYDRIWFATQDNRFWSFGLLYVFLNTAWGVGNIAFLIHIYRLIDWKKRHPLLRGILILFFIEGVAQAFYYSIMHIDMFISQDWVRFFVDWYITDTWYLQLWFSHFFFQTPAGGLQFYLVLLYFLVGLAYLNIKPIKKTRSIEMARICWIFFGFTTAIQWFAYLSFVEELHILSSIPFFEEIRTLYLDLYLDEFLVTISTVAIMLVVALFPESLLITEYQLMKGGKLYQYVDSKRENLKQRFHFVDTEKNLADYIQSLPPELKKNLDYIK